MDLIEKKVLKTFFNLFKKCRVSSRDYYFIRAEKVRKFQDEKKKDDIDFTVLYISLGKIKVFYEYYGIDKDKNNLIILMKVLYSSCLKKKKLSIEKKF
jgi:hypothetical protein